MRPALKEPCNWRVQNATTKVVLSQGALRAPPLATIPRTGITRQNRVVEEEERRK